MPVLGPDGGSGNMRGAGAPAPAAPSAPAPAPSPSPAPAKPQAAAAAAGGNYALNSQQIAQLLYTAGFRGEALVDMTAIAMRESGGQWNRVNDNAGTNDLSYGLWQINMIGGAGPQRLQQFGLGSTDDMLDPAQQARAAFILSNNGTDLSPWGGYKGVSNTFGTDIPAAQQAVAAAQSQGWRVQVPSGRASGWQTNSGSPAPTITTSGVSGSTPSVSGGGLVTNPGAGSAGTMPATPKLDAQTLAETYGFSAAFFFSDPSLKTLIDQAVGAQWSTEQFMAHLRATPWYQQHADTERKWIAQWQADPSTGRQQLNQETQSILLEARQMGVSLTPDQAHGMADKALRFGLSPDLVKQGIASEYHYQQGQVSVGQSGDLTNTYQNLAGQYGVNLSPQTLQYWIGQGLVGAGGTGAFQQYLKQTAKAQFPGLSQQLDAGMTVQQIADPYRQSMASLLEKSPDSINLQDPMLRQALAYKDPSAKPTDPPGVMPIWQFEDTVRQDPRWDQTTNAQQAAVRVAEKIGRDWGVFNA